MSVEAELPDDSDPVAPGDRSAKVAFVERHHRLVDDAVEHRDGWTSAIILFSAYLGLP
jgi:hypothetical protein